jgi:tripartite-type tricarboxylate transporter receptor subunit TctC
MAETRVKGSADSCRYREKNVPIRQGPAGFIAAAALMLGAATQPLRADPVADFYKGRTINLVIGINVGGSYDIQARLLARFLPNHIPGNPVIVPQNMVGAGGLTMANYMASVAARDGTVMGMVPNTLVPFQAVGAPGVKFDASKFQWIGTLETPADLIVVRTSTGVTKPEQARAKELTIAASAKGAITYIIPEMLNQFAGMHFKIVTGYQGSANMALALDRGEVDANVNSWPSLGAAKPEWFRNNVVSILAHSGSNNPDLKNLPTIQSLALKEEDRKVMDLVLSGDQLGRPLAFPPDVPADRIEALRKAFDAVMQDPAFREEATKLGYDIEPVGGAKLQAAVGEILSASAAIKERARPIISP